MASLHRFTSEEMFEARRALEMSIAGLAAERATGDQLASLAEEMAGMYASLDQRKITWFTTCGFIRWRRRPSPAIEFSHALMNMGGRHVVMSAAAQR
jgi:DNA-binding GntR family transcriptional regulator